MDLFPAIDLRAGRIVRLSQGAADRETSYGDDPIAQAEAFIAAGASWIHLVDLDRAFGDGDNSAAVARVVQRVGGRVRVQVSGGLRSLEAVEAALATGAARCVVGTVAITDPPALGAIVAKVGGERVAVGLDGRQGLATVRGWVETSRERVSDVCRRAVGMGVTTVIYTDVERDGMLNGPDIAGAVALQQLGARVVASGGVAKLDDIRAVRDAGLAGVIVGRAIYEGKFTLPEALAACR